MERLYEQIERIPEKHRLLVIAGVSVMLGLLYYFLLRLPAKDELSAARNRYEKIHTEYLEKKALADNLQSWQLQVQQLKVKLDEALRRLPNDVETEELLINLPNIAKRHALIVSEFKQDKERVMQGYAEVPLVLAMTGTYQGVGAFAQEVAREPRIIAVKNIKMERAVKSQEPTALSSSAPEEETETTEPEDLGVQLKMTAEAVTYRFVDPNEKPATKPGNKR